MRFRVMVVRDTSLRLSHPPSLDLADFQPSKMGHRSRATSSLKPPCLLSLCTWHWHLSHCRYSVLWPPHPHPRGPESRTGLLPLGSGMRGLSSTRTPLGEAPCPPLSSDGPTHCSWSRVTAHLAGLSMGSPVLGHLN